ncbi:hypothetical protein AB0891_33125 [Streptomyces sp. NPDC007259]|uniref:hypothetical protein n=1 Tax=Streptomyces sp. NPDC007259 TaxID=3154319 RepID=UPI003456EEAE
MRHRRDIREITDQAEHELLRAHRIGPADLIVTGTEAKVYRLDTDQVLKVYAGPDGTQAAQLQTLRTFYDRLDRDQVPYALPEIHSVEQHGPLLATREALLPGRPMGETCDLTTPPGRNPLPRWGHRPRRAALCRQRGPPHAPGRPRNSTRRARLGWYAFPRRLLGTRLDAVHDTLNADVSRLDTIVKDLHTLLGGQYTGEPRHLHHTGGLRHDQDPRL